MKRIVAVVLLITLAGCFGRNRTETIVMVEPGDVVEVIDKKKVKVRATFTYDVEVPGDWQKKGVEFDRNESSWCSDKALQELSLLAADQGCICFHVKWEYIEDVSGQYLKEE